MTRPALVLLFLLSACGGTGGGGDTPPPPPVEWWQLDVPRGVINLANIFDKPITYVLLAGEESSHEIGLQPRWKGARAFYTRAQLRAGQIPIEVWHAPESGAAHVLLRRLLVGYPDEIADPEERTYPEASSQAPEIVVRLGIKSP